MATDKDKKPKEKKVRVKAKKLITTIGALKRCASAELNPVFGKTPPTAKVIVILQNGNGDE